MIGLALTPEQYKTLLRMVYIANWVANGRREEGPFLEDYEEFEEYLFSRAKEAGFPDAAYQHKVDDGTRVHFHPSRSFEYDREIDKIISEYDDATFLDTLAERFALRALKKKFGPNAKSNMSPEEYAEEMEHFIGVYDDEILEHGLDRLTWKTDGEV